MIYIRSLLPSMLSEVYTDKIKETCVGRVAENGVEYTHRVNGGTYKRKDALRLEGRLCVIREQ